MKRNLYIGLITLFSLFVSGCTKAPNVNYNAQMHKDIKKITIASSNFGNELDVYYHNHPGMSFGLVGSLVAAAEFSSKKTTYNKLIASNKFNVSSYLVSRVAYHLAKQKYKVTTLKLEAKNRTEFLKEYPKSNTDAYLDIMIANAGYIAESPRASYKPSVYVKTRLVKNRDKSVVYDKFVSAGENFALPKEVDYVGFEENHTYKDFDTLKTKCKSSTEGIKKALDKIAKRIALSLKRG